MSDRKFMTLLGIATILVIAAALFVPSPIDETEPGQPIPADTPAKVVRIVDGDTITAKMPDEQVKYVRLLSINAPEEGEEGHDEATDKLKKLIPAGTSIVLEYDTRKQDKYGRELCYVWTVTDQERSMINLRMIESGHAEPMIVHPDIKWSSAITQAAKLRKE